MLGWRAILFEFSNFEVLFVMMIVVKTPPVLPSGKSNVDLSLHFR